MANMIVTSHYTWGDVLPFLRLGQSLKNRGHRVTLLTHGAFKEMALEAGINFIAIDAPEDYPRLLKDIGRMGDPLENPRGYMEFNDKYHGTEQLLQEYNRIAGQCLSEDTVLVARHRSSAAAYLVSEKLGIPVVPVFLAPTYIYHLPAQNELIGEFQVNSMNAVRKNLGLEPIESWLAWMSSVRNCVGFWPEWFARKEGYGPFEVSAAGFPLQGVPSSGEIPEEAEAFINAGEPPLLITGGTSMLLKSNFYQVAVEACRILNHRAILLCKHKELIPEKLPDFIRAYEFLPLDNILHRMKLILHHGGIGTIAGAARAAVPQLALAADTDRPDNALRIKEKGIGEYLPPIQWQGGMIAEKLRALMTPAVKKQCESTSAELKSKDALATAGEVIESAVGNKAWVVKYDTPTAGTSAPVCPGKDRTQAVRAGIAEEISPLGGLSEERKSALLLMVRKKRERGTGT